MPGKSFGRALFPLYGERAVRRVIEGVEVSSLDETRVRPRMGNPTVRGVWFPVVPARASKRKARPEDGNCSISG